MKSLGNHLVFVVLWLSFAAIAQEIPAPKELSGRWYTPDRMYSQLFNLRQINTQSGTAVADYYSTQSRCIKQNIPVKILWDGTKLLFAVISNSDIPMCLSTFSGELTRQADARMPARST